MVKGHRRGYLNDTVSVRKMQKRCSMVVWSYFSARSSSNTSKQYWIENADRNIQKRYSLHEVIGRGCFGVVRKCQDKRTHQWHACKSIAKQHKDNPIPIDQFQQAVRREVDNLRSLQQSQSQHQLPNPHLIQLYNIYEDDKFVHIVTELCTGGELYDLIAQWKKERQEAQNGSGKFTVQQEEICIIILKGILEGLEALHSVHHIVHRDLKAANFLFQSRNSTAPTTIGQNNQDYHIKIIDFGLSRKIPPALPMVATENDVTKPGAITISPNTDHHSGDVLADPSTLPPLDGFEFANLTAKPPGLSSSVSSSETTPTTTSPCDEDEISRLQQPPVVENSRLGQGSTTPLLATSVPSSTPPLQSVGQKRMHFHDLRHEGLVSALSSPVPPTRDFHSKMTSQVGTPFFVAPEVLLDDEYTCSCDVWSIGVIAYLLLSRGHFPTKTFDERECIRTLMNRDFHVEFPQEYWQGVSPQAQDFCAHLLQNDPRQRPTAKQALNHPWIRSHVTSSLA